MKHWNIVSNKHVVPGRCVEPSHHALQATVVTSMSTVTNQDTWVEVSCYPEALPIPALPGWYWNWTHQKPPLPWHVVTWAFHDWCQILSRISFSSFAWAGIAKKCKNPQPDLLPGTPHWEQTHDISWQMQQMPGPHVSPHHVVPRPSVMTLHASVCGSHPVDLDHEQSRHVQTSRIDLSHCGASCRLVC